MKIGIIIFRNTPLPVICIIATLYLGICNAQAKWNASILHTSKGVSYMSPIEAEVIYEMNKVRTDPQRYAREYVLPLQKLYNGKRVERPGEITIITQEGVSAVKELYQYLIDATPVMPLNPSMGLAKAAQLHADDQSKSGRYGHDSSDGADPFDRMEKYGDFTKTAGENIAYGYNTAERIVLGLLVDDGVPGRGHRTNIMKDEFMVAGVGIRPHPELRYVCVIDYAHGFIDK